MNTKEELTKLLIESYDKGVEDARQAALEAIAQIVALEREACAKVCEARYMGDNNREDMEARRCAAAIRERKS
jgi:hypothetical protein